MLKFEHSVDINLNSVTTEHFVKKVTPLTINKLVRVTVHTCPIEGTVNYSSKF